MPRTFQCPNCQHMITTFLMSGEATKCKSCGMECIVPEAAELTQDPPGQPVAHRVARPSAQPDPAPALSKITLGFNVILFCYLIVATTVTMLFEPRPADVPFDRFAEQYPLFALIAIVGLAVVGIWATIYIVRAFWNRFVCDMFGVRKLAAQEALAIVLLTACLAA